ncbi:MAG: dockerin type I repeat-containing protein, partial [Candidatus Zixiibacteriota bacterium]
LPFLLLTAIGLFSAASPARAQYYNLGIYVGDTTGNAGMKNSEISVYYTNYSDSCYGFVLTLRLDRPDIMEFGIDLDTVADTSYWRCLEYDGDGCIDSINVTAEVLGDTAAEYDWILIDTIQVMVGNVKTEGTLIENWESVWIQYLDGGENVTLRITALADYGDPVLHTPGLGHPEVSGTPLIKLLGDIFCIPAGDTDRTVGIEILYNANCVEDFIFYDENMEGISTIQDSIADTTWYQCQNWVGDSCTEWAVLPDSMAGSADSFSYDWHQFLRLDTSDIYFYDGSLAADPARCGDANCDGEVNVLDITYLINFLYKNGPEPEYFVSADVNCDDYINMLDIVYLTNFLYKNGPEPCEGCQ